MLNFYQQLASYLQQTSVVLATVTSTKGSVPREVGAKMFVCPDGTTVGTIGGGAGEAKVYQQALQIFTTGEKQFVEIDLTGAPQRETQGVCGGTMQVWLELWNTEYLLLVNQIIENLLLGKTATLVTPFDLRAYPYLPINPDNQKAKNNSSFVETLLPPPTLLIIGAGHIAVPLAKIAHITGFKIIIQDDRSEYATKERFPQASLVLAESIESIQEILANNSNLYVALVTRGYLQDLPALRLLANHQVKYIGMVGSEKRVRTVFKMLENERLKPELIQNIHAPIGLEIGALTPEEIAVSICAELIKIRRQG
jgi:xanthine dehydrogenase accessory factor